MHLTLSELNRRAKDQPTAGPSSRSTERATQNGSPSSGFWDETDEYLSQSFDHDRIVSEDTAANQEQAASSSSRLKVQKSTVQVRTKFVNIREHWFEGSTAICLQAIQKEMQGEDLCN